MAKNEHFRKHWHFHCFFVDNKVKTHEKVSVFRKVGSGKKDTQTVVGI